VALLYASGSSRKATTRLVVRPVERAAHLEFVRAAERGGSGEGCAIDGAGVGGGAMDSGAVSFLQCPSWGAVKSGWGSESIGWYRGTQLVGAATVLYRRLPRVRRCLAYLPEGPVIDWFGERTGIGIEDWLAPILQYLRRRGAFTVKMGPKVVARTWSATTLKRAMADGAHRRLGEVPADHTDPRADGLSEQLRTLAWRRTDRDGDGFSDFQPRYLFRLPLRGRDEEQLGAGLNQQWRRNIRLAQRAGVQVECVGADGLPEFHRLYLQTAARDGFTPRPAQYFQRMIEAFEDEDPERIRLYVARLDGRALAAATMVRVGSYAWYSYGASADEQRDARASNALQWRMIQDCLADGIDVYDLRGISDTLDPEHHLYGLLRFKVGLGGEAVEYLGEWDYPVSPLLHRAFQFYLARR
jgi:lipid II:glycine glycyltransferase (peptidoglycan interpeptide bridge formation enzyme)